MKIKYVARRFSVESLAIIKRANEIIEAYEAQGYQLTLRQLYYQFVSRALIPNLQQEYKKLGSVINDARLAGLISWTSIVDRTRNLQGNSHWKNPAEIVAACATQFQIDKWRDQRYRVEVWVEKDALIGIIEPVCRRLDVSYFSCRGYTSQSEMWVAAMRLKEYAVKNHQCPVIIHLGDHDPSGIDMSRDIGDRLDIFCGGVKVDRIALTMEQVDKYNPPPNPAKTTDSRFVAYILAHGKESWELDALEPTVLSALIEKTVLSYREPKQWARAVRAERACRARLKQIASRLQPAARRPHGRS